MVTSAKTVPALMALFAMTACASAPDSYPSLALRENERVTGTMEPPAPSPFVPAPAEPATIASVADLAETAAAAHRAFLAEADSAAPVVARASGAPTGSDSWAQAQVAVAGLESRRGVTMVALADLDRLYVDAVTGGRETTQIETVLRSVEQQAAAEDARIGAMLESLAP